MTKLTRERRKDLGLTQTELASRVGISVSYLNLIEHNRRSIGGRLLLGCLRLHTLLFFELRLYALSTPFFPGCGYRQTFVLPREACRLCGLLCGTMGLKQSCFSIGSSATAIGEIIVFRAPRKMALTVALRYVCRDDPALRV